MLSKSYIKKCQVAIDLCQLKWKQCPSQEELQIELKDLPKYQKKTWLQLISCMRVTLQKNYCDKFLNAQTINDIWILFYMKEKYNKLWYECSKGYWK